MIWGGGGGWGGDVHFFVRVLRGHALPGIF